MNVLLLNLSNGLFYVSCFLTFLSIAAFFIQKGREADIEKEESLRELRSIKGHYSHLLSRTTEIYLSGNEKTDFLHLLQWFGCKNASFNKEIEKHIRIIYHSARLDEQYAVVGFISVYDKSGDQRKTPLLNYQSKSGNGYEFYEYPSVDFNPENSDLERIRLVSILYGFDHGLSAPRDLSLTPLPETKHYLNTTSLIKMVRGDGIRDNNSSDTKNTRSERELLHEFQIDPKSPAVSNIIIWALGVEHPAKDIKERFKKNLKWFNEAKEAASQGVLRDTQTLHQELNFLRVLEWQFRSSS
ncbi:MAG: hypothetical protein HRT74_13890, partial [Flavobacteriales bacterium]|nr:hypothetical protein [Flavobacteriales bacterium]